VRRVKPCCAHVPRIYRLACCEQLPVETVARLVQAHPPASRRRTSSRTPSSIVSTTASSPSTPANSRHSAQSRARSGGPRPWRPPARVGHPRKRIQPEQFSHCPRQHRGPGRSRRLPPRGTRPRPASLPPIVKMIHGCGPDMNRKGHWPLSKLSERVKSNALWFSLSS
jgi:hypothetical protein